MLTSTVIEQDENLKNIMKAREAKWIILENNKETNSVALVLYRPTVTRRRSANFCG
jgi:hypothetical protein